MASLARTQLTAAVPALTTLLSAALRAVAALGVADHLAQGPHPVAELTAAVGAGTRLSIVEGVPASGRQ